MGGVIIPLRPVGLLAVDASAFVDASAAALDTRPRDQLGRPLRELRLSVTDRCNFRCTYCMPKSVYGRDHAFLPRSAVLDFDELVRAATAFVALGVHKIRLTGGEPLLRKDIETLVQRLARLRTVEGDAVELAMTTNGTLLRQKAAGLRAAGLQRLTVSLDALDDQIFGRMNDVEVTVAQVLDGVDAALAAGFGPVKVNMVVQRGVNEGEIVPLARYLREQYGPAVTLRFIEYMDVGGSERWRLDQVVPSDEVLARLQAHFPLAPLPEPPGSTAQRWRYLDGQGEIGLVSSVTRAFCGSCTRARLSADGQFFTCLFACHGTDVRALLREPAGAQGDDRLRALIARAWRGRDDRYSERRADHPTRSLPDRVEMHYIGG
ncbi:GTP 3',8-cyclase MoaA [Azohydromonas lata]|uniref:GTP 3',8-cyclase n=1 Tax=Azohydromonas lata TaxID=45677 RepID=A0ABU5INW6_9BURK|nr:GTP 3',8-cyclase MoaA [Azohydromonas lata]MDZ5460598.1 GTP 3',8-cyclase MoaA [Azohydromonas lata]